LPIPQRDLRVEILDDGGGFEFLGWCCPIKLHRPRRRVITLAYRYAVYGYPIALASVVEYFCCRCIRHNMFL